MARYQFVVSSNPVDGQEDEYNHWYDEQHLKDVLAVDGVVAAQRFKAAELTPTTHGYMAVYDPETDDLPRSMAHLGLEGQDPRHADERSVQTTGSQRQGDALRRGLGLASSAEPTHPQPARRRPAPTPPTKECQVVEAARPTAAQIGAAPRSSPTIRCGRS